MSITYAQINNSSLEVLGPILESGLQQFTKG